MMTQEDMKMTYGEILEHLKQKAQKYKADEYDLYEAEIGWEEWMEDYTEAEDGETISEVEEREINRILREAWDLVERKCYAVVDTKDCDSWEDIFGTEEEALNAAESQWYHLTKWEREKRVAFFVAFGDVDEYGCFDTNTATVIKVYKGCGCQWIVAVEGVDDYGDEVNEEYGPYDTITEAEELAASLRREYPEEIVKVREV